MTKRRCAGSAAPVARGATVRCVCGRLFAIPSSQLVPEHEIEYVQVRAHTGKTIECQLIRAAGRWGRCTLRMPWVGYRYCPIDAQHCGSYVGEFEEFDATTGQRNVCGQGMDDLVNDYIIVPEDLPIAKGDTK